MSQDLSPDEITKIVFQSRGEQAADRLRGHFVSLPRNALPIIFDLQGKGLSEDQIILIKDCWIASARALGCGEVEYSAIHDYPLGLKGAGGLPVINKRSRPGFRMKFKRTLEKAAAKDPSLLRVSTPGAHTYGYTIPDLDQ